LDTYYSRQPLVLPVVERSSKMRRLTPSTATLVFLNANQPTASDTFGNRHT